MNLTHLRYFLAVARTGRFTEAARQQHVTQPTVSNAVAELESEMGVRLFHRGRQVELTSQGRTLADILSHQKQLTSVDLSCSVSDRSSRPWASPCSC